MPAVCVADGLVVDGTGALNVNLDDLHRATITRAVDQNIAASAGGCSVLETKVLWDQTFGTDVGGLADVGNSRIVIARDGLYHLHSAIADGGAANQTPIDGNPQPRYEVGIVMKRNGSNVAHQRVVRLSPQGIRLQADRVLECSAGDTIETFFEIHRDNGPTAPHLLIFGGSTVLQATQLPLQQVLP